MGGLFSVEDPPLFPYSYTIHMHPESAPEQPRRKRGQNANGSQILATEAFKPVMCPILYNFKLMDSYYHNFPRAFLRLGCLVGEWTVAVTDLCYLRRPKVNSAKGMVSDQGEMQYGNC